jgi:hypothetical protein
MPDSDVREIDAKRVERVRATPFCTRPLPRVGTRARRRSYPCSENAKNLFAEIISQGGMYDR